MKSLLLVIDLQNAFINENTETLPSKIEEIIESNQYDDVAFTRFINFEGSIFIQKLNWRGCLSDEDKRIVIDTKDCKVFNKSIYSTVTKELIEYIHKNEITEIYLCGIDTDGCVLKTALDLFELEYNVYVLENLCGSTYGIERHKDSIKILKRNIGENYVI